MIMVLLLIFFVTGCGMSKTIILKDREQIFPHPTNPDQVCLDKGYMVEIFEELEKGVGK